MIKKSKLAIAVCAIAACAFIGGIVAYMTDADTATNNFVIGQVGTDLEERSWRMPDDIVPRQVVAKDPTVTNAGENPQYVFLEVLVPHEVRITANTDGTKNAEADIQLFSLDNLSSDWVLVESDTTDFFNTGYYTYVYAYGTRNAMTKLHKDEVTEALFTSVTYKNVVEDDEKENDKYYIHINAYATQTENLNDNDVVNSNNNDGKRTPSEVWSIVKNQNPDLD